MSHGRAATPHAHRRITLFFQCFFSSFPFNHRARPQEMKKNMISADALDDDLALEELPHGSDNKRKAFDHDSDDYGLDHDHDHSHSHGHKYDTHTKNAAQILTNPPAKKKKDHKKIIAVCRSNHVSLACFC